jgi:MYXO-CTERM domain-containing protein
MIGSALALGLGMTGTTVFAADIELGKIDEAKIKSVCGSDFVSDGQTYGCTKKCTGGTCSVICDKDDGCFGSTPQSRPQASDDQRGAFDTLNALSAMTDPTPQSGRPPWGLLGLLGLAGLLVLVRRPKRQP